MPGSKQIFEIDINELKRIFSKIATPVAIVDLYSEQILFFNSSAEELTGYVLEPHPLEPYVLEPQQPLSFLKLFSSQHTNLINAIIELAKGQGSSFLARENDIEVRRKTGRPCPVNLSAALMQGKKQNFLIITLEDLSEVKKNEIERQKLLEKSAHDSKLIDIGRLAAGMAHELNNPLAILMGYSENLESLVMDGNNSVELLKKSIVPIRKSALRMSKIISKMMAKIRNEPLKKEIHSLKQVVQETLTILEDVVASQSVELKVEVQDHWINCDSSQIEQIITNIIMNALNALSDRKEKREICIRSFEKEGMSVLEVWNNGSPIPEKVQSQIFTPFFTTKNPGEGTGLGLYMSFNLMKAHSGNMSFTSDELSGTSFFLNFPHAEAPSMGPQFRKIKTLIVDDDLFFRKMLHLKLKGLNVECCEARDGEEALALLAQTKTDFELVLVDSDMPKMKGIEFLSKAKIQYPHIHFALISATAPSTAPSMENLDQLRALGIDDTLSKPLINSELINLLDKVRSPAAKKLTA